MAPNSDAGEADSAPDHETTEELISARIGSESPLGAVASTLVTAGFYLLGGLVLLAATAAISEGDYVGAAFLLCGGLVALPVVRRVLSDVGVVTNDWVALTTVVSLVFAWGAYGAGEYGTLILFVGAAAVSWPGVRTGLSTVGLLRRRLGPWEGATAVITMYLIAFLGDPRADGRRAIDTAETEFLILTDAVMVGYVSFLVGTAVGALVLGRVVGQGVGLVVWRHLHDEAEDWRRSRFWDEAAAGVRVRSAVMAWLALVVGYLWLYDVARVLLVGVFVTACVGMLAVAVRTSPYFDARLTVRYHDNKRLVLFFLVWFVVAGYLYWVVLESFLYGVPGAVRREIITEVAVFALLTVDILPVFLLFFVVVLALLALTPEIEAFKDRVADQISVIQSETDREAIANMNAAFEAELDESLGKFFIAVVVPWLLIVDLVESAVASLLFVVVLLEVYLIVFALWTLIRYERTDFSRTIIKKFLYRDFVRSCVNLGALLVMFSVATVVIDPIGTWYARSVVPNLSVVLSPETERLLSTQPLTPAGYREVTSVYLDGRAYVATYFADVVALLVGTLALIVFTPLFVSVLYFWQIRSLLSLVGSYLGFAALNIGLESALAGELITTEPLHPVRVWVLSLVPAIVANLWVEIAAAFKEFWSRIDCPGCGELIKADSSVCRFCGLALTECPSCGAITRNDVNACGHCGVILRDG